MLNALRSAGIDSGALVGTAAKAAQDKYTRSVEAAIKKMAEADTELVALFLLARHLSAC